ncbi:SURF1 family protein [bacterium SCSIO 12696]|nr:SURF1 family protein [bacterium SCSIO 12696]
MLSNPNKNNRHFAPNWKILLLAALLLPVLLSLGNWQLKRADEKRAILAQLQQRAALPPAPIEQLMGTEQFRYRATTVTGRYDNQRHFLLDNRVRQGQPGYEVITPLQTPEGNWLLINRGWIKAPRLRSQLPEISTPDTTVMITASLYAPLDKASSLYGAAEGWPKVIQNLNFSAMAKDLDATLPSLTLRLQANQSGALQTGWPVITVQPERHTGYAVTWFSMAVALTLLTLITCFPKRATND